MSRTYEGKSKEVVCEICGKTFDDFKKKGHHICLDYRCQEEWASRERKKHTDWVKAYNKRMKRKKAIDTLRTRPKKIL